jgi:hypothetical protein
MLGWYYVVWFMCVDVRVISLDIRLHNNKMNAKQHKKHDECIAITTQ